MNYTIIKIIAISFFIFFINLKAIAQTNNPDFIKNLETQLFNTTYTTQSTAERLSRLEEVVLGQSLSKDPENVRIARLQALLGPNSSQSNSNVDKPADINVVPPNSIEDTINNSNSDPSVSEDYNKYSIQSPDTGSNPPVYSDDTEVEDYPAVSYIEEKVFNKTFKGEDVTKRLDRLEQNLFNKTKSNLSLSERLDSLKTVVLGNAGVPVPQNGNNDEDISTSNNSFSPNRPFDPSNPFNRNNYNLPPNYRNHELNDIQQENGFPSVNNSPNMPDDNTGEQMSDESINQITDRLEQQILGKTFSNEPINARLDRMEMQVFNKTSSNSTTESRVERLVAVTAAENTSDPGDMKKVKRLRKIQTGLSVGGLLFTILSGFLF